MLATRAPFEEKRFLPRAKGRSSKTKKLGEAWPARAGKPCVTGRRIRRVGGAYRCIVKISNNPI
jgi:hypothetical protein